jgi:transcriptional regulator with XRE-family HTH domain
MQQLANGQPADEASSDAATPNEPDDSESREIGTKLRALRSERGLSISDLAARAGVSAGIISQIERGKSNPSVKTLQRIRTGLGVSLWAFLEQPAPASSQDPTFVRRADDRLRIVVGRSKLIKELLSPINHESLRFMTITMPPHSRTEEVVVGAGEKGGFVVEGAIELTVGDRTSTLTKDDSFQFRSDQPHRVVNATDAPARIIWIMSMQDLHL